MDTERTTRRRCYDCLLRRVVAIKEQLAGLWGDYSHMLYFTSSAQRPTGLNGSRTHPLSPKPLLFLQGMGLLN